MGKSKEKAEERKGRERVRKGREKKGNLPPLKFRSGYATGLYLKHSDRNKMAAILSLRVGSMPKSNQFFRRQSSIILRGFVKIA